MRLGPVHYMVRLEVLRLTDAHQERWNLDSIFLILMLNAFSIWTKPVYTSSIFQYAPKFLNMRVWSLCEEQKPWEQTSA